MPKYDYRCTACGHVYEKREGFDAPSVQQCERCAGEARRVFTPPAIVFKGSGWYKTDSRGAEPSSGSSSSTSTAETKTESKVETKAESKPAAPAPAASEPAAAE